jgi:hypothetical protein
MPIGTQLCKRLTSLTLIAASCFALAAPAAQARPISLVLGSQPGTWKARQTANPAVLSEPMLIATPTASHGFDWADGAIGTVAAAGLLVLARVAGGRVRPRDRTAS